MGMGPCDRQNAVMALRPLRSVLLAATPILLLGLSSCCTMARFFCGPDDSRWVSIAFDSPTATVATLLEAIRRDAPDVIYQCMSQEWKQRHKLGSLEAQLGWQMLRDEVPGIHLIGYAEIPTPERRGDNGAMFVIEEAGQRLRLDLVRKSFQEVVYGLGEGRPLKETCRPLTSWNARASVELIEDADTDRSRLVLEPLAFEHMGLDEVPLATIERAGLVRRWHIDELRVLEE